MFLKLFDDRSDHIKAKALFTFAALITANIAAWLWTWIAFANQPALLGTALLAYIFGIRHAFDADHIAAIDNVVRKLMNERKAPFSAGFFFSLGHSTVVILASIAIAATAATIQSKLDIFKTTGGLIGTSVSAAFLLLMGVANLFILRTVWATFKRARRGETVLEDNLDSIMLGGGVLAYLFKPLFQVVSRSWHMYPIGFLFGLGFDTATEIGVLGISATQATQGMSYWSILVFPALFTAGMSLMDTTDSLLMTRAYGWAFVNPVRKLWYNLTITAASVVVAMFIGGIEALGLIGGKLGLRGGVWKVVAELNDNLAYFGYAVVGIFVVSWMISTLVYRFSGCDNLPVARSTGD